MAELGQQTVDFSSLVKRAAEDSFVSLKELVEKCRSSEQSDTEKKLKLLKYINQTQQRMLRLNVLAKWCQQVPLINYCQEQLASTLSSHDACFVQGADSLYFMHEGLQQARAPIYDVPSASEALLTGSYRRLPKCIEDIGNQGTLTGKEQKPALKKLDSLVRTKLLEVSIPKEFTEVKVVDGTASLCVEGEFKVLITLGYRGHLSLWRILHLELLVGEKSGAIKMEESRRYALGDDLERRMAAAEHPFSILYSILHELCVALVMDTVIKQAQALRQGRWKDAIRFELISDQSGGHGGSSANAQLNQDGEADSASLRTPGIKIIYWLESDKITGSSHSGSCPFIRIEPGEDMQIRCVHSTFVIDPITGKMAEFSLNQSCIDVEKLLLRAIYCNRYTRLLKIQKELANDVQICRTTDDVTLQSHMNRPEDARKNDRTSGAGEFEGQEVLRVRAYGSSFFTLGINIRNGRFFLQSPVSVVPTSVLVECEEALNLETMSAAEVFTNLRRKSMLKLFARNGKLLGLEVYENGFAAVEIPKNVLNGSPMLLMGFPDCGSSYFLSMQLDKDFKPVFRLLETQLDSSGKAPSTGSNIVIRMKSIDINQLQMLEDEQSLSLLNLRKLLPLLSNAEPPTQTSEHGILSGINHQGSMHHMIGSPPSSFSSVVDEVFELEKGVLSVQNHLGSVNVHSVQTRTPSPKWEGGMQMSQVNNAAKVSGMTAPYNVSSHPSSNLKGPVQSSSFSSLPSVPGRSSATKKLSGSKSDQDLPSLRSPQPVEVNSSTPMDEDQKDPHTGSRLSRLLSPPRPTGPRAAPSPKSNGLRNSPNGPQGGSFRISGSSPLAATPISQAADSATDQISDHDAVFKHDKHSRKRTISDILKRIPSLGGGEADMRVPKRRKISESTHSQPTTSQALVSEEVIRKFGGYNYGNLIAEANKGKAPCSVYIPALLHVVRHCSLCIKHARLTSQMDALDIPYVEEAGLRGASSNIWFRIPLTRGDSWQHICLRLGRPGSMHWDVKITDQHFRDLWDLQKGSNNTPWGSGVRIANASDVDSHIRYDPEGVVLSYQSVESDSIKKLVADIRRLSNARTFALGMRKLLGVRSDERTEENADIKTPLGAKGSLEAADRLSEQLKKSFRIEAVGLMSLWFSYNVCGAGGTTVVARFVVEWDSGKEGCTMHVSPDQLWPHTKFLEDFINGAEVQSLLDCIRLTAGPLHALAAATRPARAGPIPGVPGVAAAISSIPKQPGYLSSQGLLPSSSITNPATSASAGNAVAPTTISPLSNHSLHGAAMLAAAGRGGPGIVPSSLLPIDVSVVLRGPYWIRIIYRKDFAVDMRCFAGDQVWLQPATPPKGGPSVGGSLPCPQFRPFIMEHVAQELNGSYDSTFAGGQQPAGLANTNTSNTSSAPQQTAGNGNRVNLPGTAAISRAGNQVPGLNRMSSAMLGSSSISLVNSGISVRRPPNTNVPPHLRGELNTAIIGLGDDGGYGGGWVPVVALKKVLRGILKYLGVLWLFAQLPDILKEILGSILKDNEGALLNLDQEQPALRFFVGGYVFAVSVHRVQLLLQVLSVKRFHHQQQQQQQQQQQNSNTTQEELTQAEISEICDYFSRRVASEPYDASRVASFITLLTLPISVLREFLKLIAWKKGLVQAQGGDIAPAQKPRIELCLENHVGLSIVDKSENVSASKSSIHYDRPHNSVDFSLTVVLDPAHIPLINAAGGAAWLPYCVSVRLRYSFGENHNVSFLGMEGSHGGRACWLRIDDWEKCKHRVARTVEVNGCAAGDLTQGKLKIVADSVQRTLHMCLQALRDGSGASANSAPA